METLPVNQKPQKEPTNAPVAICTDIIDSYRREELWKQWGKKEWAAEEAAGRERSMTELRNMGYTSLVPLLLKMEKGDHKP